MCVGWEITVLPTKTVAPNRTFREFETLQTEVERGSFRRQRQPAQLIQLLCFHSPIGAIVVTNNLLTMISQFIGHDRLLGKIILPIGIMLFLYYTSWVLIHPIVPKETPIALLFDRLFPLNPMIAVAFPILSGTIFFSLLSCFAFIKLRG